MKKIISKTFLIITLLMIVNLSAGSRLAFADWWNRPDTLPTQSSIPRDIILPTLPLQPTTAPQPSTAPTIAPTIAPTNNPPTGGTTPSDPGGSGSGSGGNDCDPGKSYVGPYCGWSPSVGNSDGGGGGSEQPRIGGPQVLGLSYTSSREIDFSDIMLLAGVLCLALYARSKLVIDSSKI